MLMNASRGVPAGTELSHTKTRRHEGNSVPGIQESFPDFVVFVTSCETQKTKPQRNADERG